MIKRLFRILSVTGTKFNSELGLKHIYNNNFNYTIINFCLSNTEISYFFHIDAK